MADAELIEQCREAIKAFCRARSTHENVDLTEIGEDWSRRDSEYLAGSGYEGLRYGAGSCGDLKLRFIPQRGFYLNRNGMDLDEFRALQELVAKEIEASGLRFYPMSS